MARVVEAARRLLEWMGSPPAQRVPRPWLHCPICDRHLVGPYSSGLIGPFLYGRYVRRADPARAGGEVPRAGSSALQRPGPLAAVPPDPPGMISFASTIGATQVVPEYDLCPYDIAGETLGG